MVIFSWNLFGQISPGDLSEPHANLEGIKNCTKCHDIGNQVSDKKCLTCHTHIRELITGDRGYHSISDVKRKNCSDCHSEHFGRDFKLIKFNAKDFNHSLTGYILTGKHAVTECGKCHTDQVRIKMKKKNRTFLGLSANCLSCHEDYHQGTLSSDCSSCHSTNSFKKAENFDHNKAKFKLIQSHLKVDCDKCHQTMIKNGKKYQKFTGLSFVNCYSCHNDVHNNKFGKDCKSCHVVAGFKFINNKTFDHHRTRFPLLGKHINLNCNECHKTGISTKPSFENCYNCHSDFHSGEFTSEQNKRDCSECHNINGFAPSLFTIENHNQLKFPLEGKHLAVGCRQCHFKEDKWHFRLAHNECNDCHENIHKNDIKENVLTVNGCRTCHNTTGWNRIEFNHTITGYELTGKHKTLDCRKCHYDEETNVHRFKSINSECESCHKDKHFSQFTEENKTNCERCHSTVAWQPLIFDHNITRFKLDGKHSNVACNKCHHKMSSDGMEYIQYKQENIKCSACHS